MAALAEIQEAADLSEAKADAHLEEVLSKLRENVLLTYDQVLDLEADAIALFKLAVLETRKIDDVATIAATWMAVAEAYTRTSDKLKKGTQKEFPKFEALEMTAGIPPHITHTIQRLETLTRAGARALRVARLGNGLARRSGAPG